MKASTLALCALAALAVAGCRGGDGNGSRNAAEPANASVPAANRSAEPAGNGAQRLELDGQAAVNNCLSREDQARAIVEFNEDQRREIVSCINGQAAGQINARLPIQVDEVTRLDRVSAEGPELTYHYTVQVDSSALPENATQQLEGQTRAFVCGQAEMRQTLSLGGSYAYIWNDQDGDELHRMRVASC